MAKTTEMVEVAVEMLRPYERNAKKHPQEQLDKLKKSIQEFGFISPCLIDRENRIIAGHGRVEAAKQAGIYAVPCVYVEGLSDEQRRAYILADNRLTELGGWDMDLVNDELAELELSGFDVELTGFDLPEDEPDVAEDDFGEDSVPEEPRTKPGELWALGEHRLVCGDCTDPGVLETLMAEDKADMVFTGPPYGMDLDTDYSSMVNSLDITKDKKLKGGNKYEQGKVDEFEPKMVSTALAMGAKEVFLWGADYYAELLPDKNNGSWIVWDKRANGNNDDTEDYSSDKMYGSCFELCWSKSKHKRDIARVKWAGIFGMEQEFDRKRWHPTQKPIKLVSWFLTRYSEKGQTVADIFGGSGSTLIACEQLGRKCRMVELDPHYCDVIIERWEQFTGRKAVLING